MCELRVIAEIGGMVKFVMRRVSTEGQTLVEVPGEVEPAVFFGDEDQSEESPRGVGDHVHVGFEDEETAVNW